MKWADSSSARMEYIGAKYIHSLKLAILLMVTCLTAFAASQEVKSWTFNIPDVSFLSFSPVLTATQNQRIALKFRTRNPNGLIFCHYLKDLDVKELERINYRLCAELQYGLFLLNYRLMQYSEPGLSLGTGKMLFFSVEKILELLTCCLINEMVLLSQRLGYF